MGTLLSILFGGVTGAVVLSHFILAFMSDVALGELKRNAVEISRSYSFDSDSAGDIGVTGVVIGTTFSTCFSFATFLSPFTSQSMEKFEFNFGKVVGIVCNIL